MKKWTINLTIEVSENWINDGFDAAERLSEIEEKVSEILPYAILDQEIKVKAKIKPLIK